jgi:ABC-type branched-subunit amino acid transport system substrate-binding protein
MMPVATIPWHEAFWAQFVEFHPPSEAKTFVLMRPDSEQYAANEQGIIEVHESYGHELLFVQKYAQFSVDFYPFLTKVVAANPDIVDLNGGGHGDNDLIVKQLRELGYEGLIVGPMHGEPYSTIEIAGCDFAEGFITNDPDYLSDLYPEATREIAADIMRRYPEASLALTTYLSFNAVEMYVAGMQWAGSIDPDEVMKVFDDPDFEYSAFGISGRKLGGMETNGIRRNWQDEVCYSEVINCEKVMLSRKATTMP